MFALAVILASVAQLGSALIPCWRGNWCASGWKCREQVCTFNWFQKCKYCIWTSWGREEFDASAMVLDDAAQSVIDDAAQNEFDSKFQTREEFEKALKMAEKTLKDGARAEVGVVDVPEQWYARVWPVPAVVAVVALAAACIVAVVVRVSGKGFNSRSTGLLAAA